VRLPSGGLWTGVLEAGERQLASLQALNDPRGIYMLCECGWR
jgi:hypothetical protein